MTCRVGAFVDLQRWHGKKEKVLSLLQTVATYSELPGVDRMPTTYFCEGSSSFVATVLRHSSLYDLILLLTDQDMFLPLVRYLVRDQGKQVYVVLPLDGVSCPLLEEEIPVYRLSEQVKESLDTGGGDAV